MMSIANRVNRILRIAAVVSAGLQMMSGGDSLMSPESVAKAYGIPETSTAVMSYLPVFGVLDVCFGMAVIALLIADCFNMILVDGGVAAGYVLAVSTLFGFGERMMLRRDGASEVLDRSFFGKSMIVTAFGLPVTSWLARPG